MPSTDSMVGSTLGNLRIVSELGKGGMGVVYLAEHVTLQKRFAVKCLSPELTRDPMFSERFYQEAKNQALLDHPNIVEAVDFFEAEGQYALVMEYVEGQELGDLIKAKGKLSEPEALKIFKEILAGLGFAHRKGMIHRDMKPSNVLIDGDGRARIMDFGIAILAGEKRLTATGFNVGSPWYMSPEQISHPKEIDRRSDIYSLGIVLYEMLTGDVPFDSDSEFEIKNQQINARAPDSHEKDPSIDKDLAQIIMRAMEKKPEQRFQSCEEFCERIEAYQREKQVVPASRPGAPLLISLALLLVAVSVGLYFLLSHHKEVIPKTPPVPLREAAPLQRPEAAQPPVGAVPPKPQEEFSQTEREAADSLIKSALDQASIVCIESDKLPPMRGMLQIAVNIGDTALADSRRKTISDIENNIREGVNNLNGILADLSAKPKLTREQMATLEQSLRKEEKPKKLKLLRLLGGHYRQYLQTGSKLDATTLADFCAARH